MFNKFDLNRDEETTPNKPPTDNYKPSAGLGSSGDLDKDKEKAEEEAEQKENENSGDGTPPPGSTIDTYKPTHAVTIHTDDNDKLTVPDKGVNDVPITLMKKDELLASINFYGGIPEEQYCESFAYNKRYSPLNARALETPKHRVLVFDKYHLRIGDCMFVIPPENFTIKENSKSVKIPSIRKASTIKLKGAYSTKDISFSLYFNGEEQINGYEVRSPFTAAPYFLDGLRSFLAQCKVSPIMPVENEFLNVTCGVYNIAIQSVNVSVVPGFPKLLRADVMAIECNTSTYTMSPEYEFTNLIEWDLYRYNYQRFITRLDIASKVLGVDNAIPEGHKLKPVKRMDEDQKIIFSILSDESVGQYKDDEENLLDLNKAKFVEVVSNTGVSGNNFHIDHLSFGTSNIIVTTQLSNHTKPALQYLGGGDTVMTLHISTTDSETVSKFVMLSNRIKFLTMKLKDSSGMGFVRVENQLVNMLGSHFMLIEGIEIKTVPGFPDLYSIGIELCSYDSTSLMAEEIRGFKPFPKSKERPNPGERDGTKEDCISQNLRGVVNQIEQDLVAEHHLATKSILYPDLFVPTYVELDKAINYINEYRGHVSSERSRNRSGAGIPPLPYERFPRSTTNDIQLGGVAVGFTHANPDYYFTYAARDFTQKKAKSVGGGMSRSVARDEPSSGGIDFSKLVITDDIKQAEVGLEYVSCVVAEGTQIGSGQGSGGTYNGPTGGDMTGSGATSCNQLGIQATGVVKAYLDFLFAKVGCGYKLGAIGQVMSEQVISELAWAGGRVERKWMGIEIYDCSGFVAYGMHRVGWFDKTPRMYHMDIFHKYCSRISESELQPGDLAFNGHHIVTFIGAGQTVEAANPDRGVCIGKMSWQKYTIFGRLKWPSHVLNAKGPTTPGSSTPNGETITARGVDNSTSSNTSTRTFFNADKSKFLDGVRFLNPQKEERHLRDMAARTPTAQPSDGGSSKTPSNNNSQNNGSNTVDPGNQSGPVVLGKYNDKRDRHDGVIYAKCQQIGLDPNWMKALITQESNMDESCGPNGANAVGLMQVTTDPCKELGMPYDIAKLKTPEYNLDIGFRYFKKFLDSFFPGQYLEMCCGYNMGPYGYKDYLAGKRGLPGETKIHRQKCQQYYNQLIANGGSGSFSGDGTGVMDPNAAGAGGNVATFAEPKDKVVKKEHGEKKADTRGRIGTPLFSVSPIAFLGKAIKDAAKKKAEEEAKAEQDRVEATTPPPTTTKPPKPTKPTKPKPPNVVAPGGNEMTPAPENPDITPPLGTGGGSILPDFPRMGVNPTNKTITNNSRTVSNRINGELNPPIIKPTQRMVTPNSYIRTPQARDEEEKDHVTGGSDNALNAATTVGPTTAANLGDVNVDKNGVVKPTHSVDELLGNSTYDDYTRELIRKKTRAYINSIKPMLDSLDVIAAGTSGIEEHGTSIGGWLSGALDGLFHSLDTEKEYHILCKMFTDPNNEFLANTMTVNDCHYNKRGSMLRAFPTYCLLLSHDNSSWLDARRLWNNYYPYKSVTSMSIFHEKEQPVGTAKIRVTNLTNNLKKNPSVKKLRNSITEDSEYSYINKFLYKNFGFIVGSPKVTQDMVDMRNQLFEEFKIEPGVRIHIRMGYGSNPSELNVMFNGTVAEVTAGEELEIIAQSDGAELVNNVVSTDKEKTNGLTKFQSEPSNIITSLLIDRESWTNIFSAKWGEQSEYHIEHFGIYTGHNAPAGRELEYDLCKNIYLGKFKKELFCSRNDNPNDGERNAELFLYNKTPWDIMQTVCALLPEFVCQPRYHQFRSTLFFGLPTWLYKYRYFLTSNIMEQAKTFQQVHMIDFDDIIDNRIKTSSRFVHTNVVTMYTLGSNMRASPTLFADKTLDWSKQKTLVVDSIIQQDFVGWDRGYEFAGLDEGRENAICIGLSTLVNEFEKMYYDEIITLGKPGIFPCDQIFINDDYGEMYGMANVRAVTHTLSPETGFISSISPGLNAYCKTEDSGSTNVYRSIVHVMDVIASVLSARKHSVDVLNTVADVMYPVGLYNMEETIVAFRKMYTNATIATSEDWAKHLNKVIDGIQEGMPFEIKKRTEFLTWGTALDAIANYTPIKYLGKLLLKLPLLSDIYSYFKYGNCIGIRPLYHRGGPFCSLMKGSTGLIDGLNGTPGYEDDEDYFTRTKEPAVKGTTQHFKDLLKDIFDVDESDQENEEQNQEEVES